MEVSSVTGSTGTSPSDRNQRTASAKSNEGRVAPSKKRETPPDRGRQEVRNSYGDRAETSRGL